MSRRVVITRAAVLVCAVSIPAAVALGSDHADRRVVSSPVRAPVTNALPVAGEPLLQTERLTAPVAGAIARAIAAAQRDGVTLVVTSGWRSWDKQQQLYDEALAKYGTPVAARRWVLPPSESAHVQGTAVDVGPPAGAKWLRRNGVRFGLCQRYANEPWHFERLAAAKGSRCPPVEPHP